MVGVATMYSTGEIWTLNVALLVIASTEIQDGPHGLYFQDPFSQGVLYSAKAAKITLC